MNGNKKAFMSKGSIDMQILQDQEARFRAAFVASIRPTTSGLATPIILPEPILISGFSSPIAPRHIINQHTPKSQVNPSEMSSLRTQLLSISKSCAKLPVKSQKTPASRPAKLINKRIPELLTKNQIPHNSEVQTSAPKTNESSKKTAPLLKTPTNRNKLLKVKNTPSTLTLPIDLSPVISAKSSLFLQSSCKPNVPLLLIISQCSFPLKSSIEIIEELNLNLKSSKSITIKTYSNYPIQKPCLQPELSEDSFASKYPPIIPGVQLNKLLQCEQEDWNIRRGPPVIKIIANLSFTTLQKPLLDFCYQKKAYIEKSLQTEDPAKLFLTPEDPIKVNQVPLTFDQFCTGINKELLMKPLGSFVVRESNRVNRLDKLKIEVKEKELFIKKRLNAAVKIQACIRGFLIRKKIFSNASEYNEKLRQIRISAVAKKIKAQWAPYAILNALRKWCMIKKREKQRIYRSFLRFSAICIQRCWRGYRIRRFYNVKIGKVGTAKDRIRRLVRRWKASKINKTRRIAHCIKNIREIKSLLNNIHEDPSALGLSNQLKAQIAGFYKKIRSDFNTLYQTGSWTALPIDSHVEHNHESLISPKLSKEHANKPSIYNTFPIVSLKSAKNDEINRDSAPRSSIKFLKRHSGIQAYNSKVQKQTENSELKQEILKTPEDSNHTGPAKIFLKRKSKAVQPHKLNWQAKRRIDCWFPSSNQFSSISQQQSPALKTLPMTLQEIELEFRIHLKNSATLSLHDSKPTASHSKIPSILPNSKCLKSCAEDSFQDLITSLEARYNYLCSAEILSNQ